MIVKRQEEKNKQNYADFRIIAEKKKNKKTRIPTKQDPSQELILQKKDN